MCSNQIECPICHDKEINEECIYKHFMEKHDLLSDQTPFTATLWNFSRVIGRWSSTEHALVAQRHEAVMGLGKFRVVSGILERWLDHVKSVLLDNQLPEFSPVLEVDRLQYPYTTLWQDDAEFMDKFRHMEKTCIEYTKQLHEDRVTMQAENAKLRNALERWCHATLSTPQRRPLEGGDDHATSRSRSSSSSTRLVSNQGDTFVLDTDTLVSSSPFFGTALNERAGFVEGQTGEIVFPTCQTKALQFVLKAIIVGESNADVLTLDISSSSSQTKSLLVDIYNVSEMLLVPWVTQTAVRCCLEHADISCSLILEVIKVCRMLVTAHTSCVENQPTTAGAALLICAFARQKHQEAADKLAARVSSIITLDQLQDNDDECAQIFLSW